MRVVQEETGLTSRQIGYYDRDWFFREDIREPEIIFQEDIKD